MSTEEEKKKALSRFLKDATLKESFKAGRIVSQTKMATMTGVAQGSWSQWENETRLPNDENTHKLVDHFGPIICDILEIPRLLPRDKMLIDLVEAWPDIPKDIRKKALNIVLDARDEFNDRMKNFAGDIKTT